MELWKRVRAFESFLLRLDHAPVPQRARLLTALKVAVQGYFAGMEIDECTSNFVSFIDGLEPYMSIAQQPNVPTGPGLASKNIYGLFVAMDLL